MHRSSHQPHLQSPVVGSVCLTCEKQGRIEALGEDRPLVDNTGKYRGEQRIRMSKHWKAQRRGEVLGVGGRCCLGVRVAQSSQSVKVEEGGGQKRS